MTDDRRKKPGSDPKDSPKRSGSPASIGRELELGDFEPDALLDSLLSDASEEPSESSEKPGEETESAVFEGSDEFVELDEEMITEISDPALPPTAAPPAELTLDREDEDDEHLRDTTKPDSGAEQPAGAPVSDGARASSGEPLETARGLEDESLNDSELIDRLLEDSYRAQPGPAALRESARFDEDLGEEDLPLVHPDKRESAPAPSEPLPLIPSTAPTAFPGPVDEPEAETLKPESAPEALEPEPIESVTPFRDSEAGVPAASELSDSDFGEDEEETQLRETGRLVLPDEAQAPQALGQEQPAAAYLSEEQSADLLVRAEWLEQQSASLKDPQSRARTLLTASELWALAGDLERARQAAESANLFAGSLPLVSRQVRLLAAEVDDYKAVTASLDAEMRAGPTPEARAHAAYVNAEIHRLVLDEPVTGRRKLDVVSRAVSDDARTLVYRLGEQLARAPVPPKVRLADAEGLEPIAEAAAMVGRLRGGPGQVSAPILSYDEARRGLSARDRAGAARALLELRAVAGLDRAASWLAVSLLSPSAATRQEAIAVLTKLLEQHPNPETRQALAARALEQGDQASVETALFESGAVESGTSEEDAAEATAEAFSEADRLALWALTKSSVPSSNELPTDASPGLEPALTAVRAALGADRSDSVPGAEARALAELNLGRMLAIEAASAGLEPDYAQRIKAATDRYIETAAESPLARLLILEAALQARSIDTVAQTLSEWHGRDRGAQESLDAGLCAVLVREAAADTEGSMAGLRELRDALPKSEAIVRALMGYCAPAERAELLTALSEACDSPEQAALLLIEASTYAAADEAASTAQLRRAAELLPTFPLAYQLGDRKAREQGDAQALLKWLRLRHQASPDPVEKALDLVREALLVAEGDVAQAADLLSQAVATRPSDAALHELHERLAPEPTRERGQWRETLAESETGVTQTWLLQEAALEYERAELPEDAARAATRALERGASEMAAIMAERTARAGPAATRIAERLLAEARAETDERARCELYERLSAFDEARGEMKSALLWQATILEKSPGYLPALRRLEHEFIGTGRDIELEAVATELAGLDDRAEAEAHVVLATRLKSLAGRLHTAQDIVEKAAQRSPPSLFALRTLSTLAHGLGNQDQVLKVERQLLQRASNPLDQATHALRAAEAAVALEDLELAQTLLEQARDHLPTHLVVLSTLVQVLQAQDKHEQAAETLEQLAEASLVKTHQALAYYQAAGHWLDHVKNVERGMRALEQAAERDINHADTFTRLQTLYVARKERDKLASLLERRLAATTDPEERVMLEVSRGRALAGLGDRAAARKALSAALDAHPEHTEALDAFAQLCIDEGDYSDAEQAFIRLARHSVGQKKQAEIYKKLGALYEQHLPNPERAQLAYQEVLKRYPEDAEAAQKLIVSLGKAGQVDEAVRRAAELVDKAATQEDARDQTLFLARVLEEVAGDARRAGATLDKARKTWANDSQVLRAQAEFYLRQGQERALHVLLDRAGADSRRALGTGRFDRDFFETLATVASLKGDHEGETLVRATLSAIAGEPTSIKGAGAFAGDARLDPDLAPTLLGDALRALLKRIGYVVDAAFPRDLRALQTTPVPASSQHVLDTVAELAPAFGLSNVQVLVSPSLGKGCMPASSSPPTIVCAAQILDAAAEEMTFILMRSLKIIQTGCCAMSNAAPVELLPMTAGLLSALVPNYQAQVPDPKRVADAQRRILQVLPKDLNPDIPTLALEVIGALGNRASQLSAALHQLGNRTALLGVGDPYTAMQALSHLASTRQPIPERGDARMTWIIRNTEARDLAVYGVSPAYTQARRRAGLAE